MVQMLHEILIVLAGHRSSVITNDPHSQFPQQVLHPSEQALLAQTAALGKLNRDVSRRITWVQESSIYGRPQQQQLSDHHDDPRIDGIVENGDRDQVDAKFYRGVYCPAAHAIARRLDQLLVSEFRNHLVNLESKILAKDSAYVGGQNVVSLSVIVAETVRTWERRFRYGISLLNYIVSKYDRMPPCCYEILHQASRKIKSRVIRI